MEIDTKYQNNFQDEKNESDELRPTVKMALRKISENEGYLNYEISKKQFIADGGNYMGVLYEVNIKGTVAEGNKETNLFVKEALPKCESLTMVSISEIYGKEKFVYNDLAKIFTEMQNEAQVPVEDRYNMVKNYDEITVDAIILENMRKKDFKTYHKMDIIPLKFAELCIQQLAKLHALSFVIERKMPEYFEKKIKSLKQSVAFDDNLFEFSKRMLDLSLKEITPSVKSKIEKSWTSFFEMYAKYSQGAMTDVKCLCHGDFKMNNVLYKEIKGEVAEVVPVDYQLIYYGSPIIDFLFYAFVGTDREFRKNHLNHLKNVYHNSLTTFLKYFDISVDEVYPRNVFESDFQVCLVYSLINSIIIMPFLLTADDEVPDFGKDALKDMGFNIGETFYNRMQDICDDYIEWGYL